MRKRLEPGGGSGRAVGPDASRTRG
jgi:hypothetical protein